MTDKRDTLMDEPCLNCGSKTRMIAGETRVLNGQIVTETICLDCCIVFREMLRPNKSTAIQSKTDRVRATFAENKKLTKTQILELKIRDRALYLQWKTHLTNLDKHLTDQIETNYSEYATHLLYTIRAITRFLVRQLESRIQNIDLFLKGEK